MGPKFIPVGTDPTIEWMFSLIIILACFLIYFKTKEIYELSDHKGIKYFRYVFLFFGLTYFSNLASRILGPQIRRMPFREIIPFFPMKFLAIVGVYASTAMFIYLLLSFFWKKLDKTFISNFYLIHGFSILIAGLTLFNEFRFLFFIFQTLAFFVIIFLLIIYRKKIFHKKQKLLVTIVYAMIFGHWILIIFLDVFSLYFPSLASVIYIITLCFFVILLDRLWIHFSKFNEINLNKTNEKERTTRSNPRHSSNNKRKK